MHAGLKWRRRRIDQFNIIQQFKSHRHKGIENHWSVGWCLGHFGSCLPWWIADVWKMQVAAGYGSSISSRNTATSKPKAQLWLYSIPEVFFSSCFFGLPSCFCTINGRLSWPPQDVPSCYFNSWELTKPRSWMLLSTASSKLELGSPSILQKDLSKVHVLRTNHDDLKSFIFFMFGGV